MKRFLIAIIATITLIVAFFVIMGFKTNVKIVANGESVANAQTKLINDTTMITVREVFEAMDFNVYWDENTRTAFINNDDYSVVISADEESFFVNDEEIIPEIPQRIIDGKLYLPLRSVFEAVNCNVEWDENTYTVYITEKTTYADETATEGTTETYVSTSDDFVYNLCKYMPEDKNYFISPLSIRLAMAMAVNGAENDTKTEILNALNIDDIDKFNVQTKALIEKYETDNSDEYMSDLVFEIANSIWLNSDVAGNIEFSKDFTSLIENYFKGKAETINNSNAVEKINSWVSDKTKDKITEIIDDPQFIAALVNACYFKGNWYNEFPEYATQPDTFTYRSGETAEIDFMNMTENLPYYADDNVQMVSLAYSGSKDISMYVILSNDKRLDFSKYYDLCQYQKVKVSMPKFKVEFEMTLNECLQSMGINKAFSDTGAEFKPMFENYSDYDNFYISRVLHKTYVDVDEKGTEAAAVTAIMMENTAALMEPEEPVEFKVDKPFTYVIRDNESKEILFVGEYACK